MFSVLSGSGGLQSVESEGDMREYKFRGKRVDNCEWVYGGLAVYGEHAFIVRAELQISESDNVYFSTTGIEIDHSTVGQYTGLKDKNGVEIYEGDVLRDSQGWEFEMRWENDKGRFLGHHSKARGDTYACYVGRIDRHNKPSTEVIGNIHDNPEPLQI